MALRFWTKLQMPYDQAILVEDGKVVRAINPKPPRTHARRVACIGEHNGNLVIVRPANFELWEPDGAQMISTVPMPQLYAPHGVIQWGDDLLFCSSGLDMFFICDLDGNVKREWWGKDYDMGGVLEEYHACDWIVTQTTGREAQIPVEEAAHFNSMWPNGDGFLTAALKKRAILWIDPYRDGYAHIASAGKHGVHSPIVTRDVLTYGLERGIQHGQHHLFPDKQWVKFIRETPTGYAFTHETGVTFTDPGWNIVHEVSLPRPFQFALMEGTP